MMSTCNPQCQWYQTDDAVTASLKLSPLQSVRGEITAHFEDNYCSVSVGGVLYWECHLAGRVIPDRCRMTVGKVRAEIKLKKVDPVQWTEYEAEAPCSDVAVNGLPNGQISHTHSKVTVATPVASKISNKMFCPEDLMYINHLPHDHYDLGVILLRSNFNCLV